MVDENHSASVTVDFEKDINHFPILTLSLIVVNVLVFFMQVAWGDIDGGITGVGLLDRSSVFAGEIWRVLTYMFLHADLNHLGGNMVILYVLGMACEHAVGRKQAGILYLTAGFTGALLSMVFTNKPSLGASGSIFGLLGAAVVFFLHYNGKIYLRNKNIGLFLAAWAGYSIFTGFFEPFIDNFAHLGGFIGGSFAMIFFLPVKRWEAGV